MKVKDRPSRIRSNKLGSRKQRLATLLADLAPAIVATLIVLYALVALISAEPYPDNSSAPAPGTPSPISKSEFQKSRR
jgi:hypothetical protein